MKTLVIVGTSYCGKSTFFNKIHRGHYGEDIPVDVDSAYDLNVKVRFHGTTIPLKVFDTSSSEDHFHIRRIVYLTVDVVIMMFAIDDDRSLKEIENKWYPEIRYTAPQSAPIILVGNKKDKRDEGYMKCVTFDDGVKLANRIKASAYLECSSLTDEGVLDVFFHAVRATVSKHSKRTCSLL